MTSQTSRTLSCNSTSQRSLLNKSLIIIAVPGQTVAGYSDWVKMQLHKVRLLIYGDAKDQDKNKAKR